MATGTLDCIKNFTTTSKDSSTAQYNGQDVVILGPVSTNPEKLVVRASDGFEFQVSADELV